MLYEYVIVCCFRAHSFTFLTSYQDNVKNAFFILKKNVKYVFSNTACGKEVQLYQSVVWHCRSVQFVVVASGFSTYYALNNFFSRQLSSLCVTFVWPWWACFSMMNYWQHVRHWLFSCMLLGFSYFVPLCISLITTNLFVGLKCLSNLSVFTVLCLRDKWCHGSSSTYPQINVFFLVSLKGLWNIHFFCEKLVIGNWWVLFWGAGSSERFCDKRCYEGHESLDLTQENAQCHGRNDGRVK